MMHYERLKTIILVMLITSSLILSLSLWSDWRQYDALPQWLTMPGSIEVASNDDEPLPPEPTEPESEDIDLTQIISPERMVIHKKDHKYLFWLQPSSLLHVQWQGFNMLINLVELSEVVTVNDSQWWADVDNMSGCEFIFTSNYPLEVLLPNLNLSEDKASLKVDRIFVAEEMKGSDEQQAAIYARSIYDRTYYKINLSLSTDSKLLFNWEADKYDWIEAQDLSDETLSVARGVYVPAGLIENHANSFPEVWVKYEDVSERTWLPLFFSNPNIVREITFSNEDKRVYVDGPAKLSFYYGQGTAIEYAEAPLSGLNEQEVDSEQTGVNSSIAILEDVFNFISAHSPNNWPPLSAAVRIKNIDINGEKGEADLSLKCYTVDTQYMIPIESQQQRYSVRYQEGIVTNYNRYILMQGRQNSQPLLSLEAEDALNELSSRSWLLDTWWNPYASEVVASYQAYIDQGYTVADIYLAYYSQLDSSRGEFITPHWVVVLVNQQGDAIKFYVNAMTGYMPLQNGIAVDSE